MVCGRDKKGNAPRGLGMGINRGHGQYNEPEDAPPTDKNALENEISRLSSQLSEASYKAGLYAKKHGMHNLMPHYNALERRKAQALSKIIYFSKKKNEIEKIDAFCMDREGRRSDIAYKARINSYESRLKTYGRMARLRMQSVNEKLRAVRPIALRHMKYAESVTRIKAEISDKKRSLQLR